MMALRENTVMPYLVNSSYSSMAGQKGSTIDVPFAGAITAASVTPAFVSPNPADQTPTSIPLAMDQWYEAAFYLSDKDMLEAADGFIPMQASEAVKALGNNVDGYILDLYKSFYGWVGTEGITPFGPGVGTKSATQARKVLNAQLAPLDDRYVVLDPDAEAEALELRAFQDASFGGGPGVIVEGNINRKLGFGWFMDQNVKTHTAGAGWDDGYLVNDTTQALGDTSIVVDTGTQALLVGDVFTFAGHSQTYTVTTALTGAGTLYFQPGLQAVPLEDALLTFKKTHVANLAFQRNGIAFASRPLSQINHPAVITSSTVDPVSGLTLRLQVTYEFKRTRFSYDILYGAAAVRREYGCRIAG
jgi:hypothetical protein